MHQYPNDIEQNPAYSIIDSDFQESYKAQEHEEEEEEEFNDAVVSLGEERVHNATYSKLNHVYVAGGRTYKAMEAFDIRQVIDGNYSSLKYIQGSEYDLYIRLLRYIFHYDKNPSLDIGT